VRLETTGSISKQNLRIATTVDKIVRLKIPRKLFKHNLKITTTVERERQIKK
jgi:hypothetical protein